MLSLPKTGKYIWAITEKVPPKVYLKLTVRDIAGNVAVAQTDARGDRCPRA